ncbi:MAG: sigma-70 family RNA polymerase sigma factor [Acidimicrobiales bacterium]
MTSTAVAPPPRRTRRSSCAKGPDAVLPATTVLERHTLLAGLPLAPSSKDQFVLARRVAAGDATARSEMIVANLRLVVYWAKKYQRDGVDLEDLVQEGTFGLARAVDLFDPERGIRFSTYASFWIRQALQSGVECCARAIRVPIDVVAKARQDDALDSLPRIAMSLDRDISADGPDPLIDLVASDEPSPEDLAVASSESTALSGALDALPEPGRSIIRYRFGLRCPQLSLADVARRLGIGRSEVRRLEIEALGVLRSAAVLTEIRNAVAVCDTPRTAPQCLAMEESTP